MVMKGAVTEHGARVRHDDAGAAETKGAAGAWARWSMPGMLALLVLVPRRTLRRT